MDRDRPDSPGAWPPAPATPAAAPWGGAAPLFADAGAVHATGDVGVASAVLSDTYAELTMRAPSRPACFRMRLERVDLPDVRVAVLDLSAARLRTVSYPGYTLCLPVRGRVRAAAGVDTAAIEGRSGIVVCPVSGEVAAEYLTDDCRVLTVSVERGALERELELLLGRSLGSAIRFEFALDARRCASLQRALTLLREELADPTGLAGRGLGLHQLSRLLMTGLLVGQGHQWSDELDRSAGFEGPRAIRQAIAAIAERPDAFLTVGDVARAANLSVRAVEASFRRHLGVTPMAHVRGVRLDRARDELERAEPGSTTVTAVAQRWGFGHYGRFSAQYRRRFGCSPRETLLAGRGGR